MCAIADIFISRAAERKVKCYRELDLLLAAEELWAVADTLRIAKWYL